MANGKKQINIEEDVRIAIHYQIDKFVQDEKQNELDFPPTFTNQQRAYIHEYVKNKSLKSKSHGKGSQRYLTIYKVNVLSMVYEDATIDLAEQSRRIVVNLLKKQPLTKQERSDSRRRRQANHYLPSYSLNLGNLNCSKKSIPAPANANIQISQERAKLPISEFRDTIVQGIRHNQVMVISGSTGSGKTTQVPQYIMEDCHMNKELCRIICTQPRRLSAVTVSERISYERGDQLGQTVGYQIRLESRLSPVTNLILCTNGVLLRCLMGKNSHDIIKDVTHIIVDEVHERDQHSDFLLIALREKLMSNPKLKIILMSATIESSTFSEYFNKCPVIEIPGRLFAVENYYLDEILANIDVYNDKITDLKKQAKVNVEMSYTVPQPYMDEDIISLMNDILELCWVEHSADDFEKFFYLVEDVNNPIDFKHTETEMTALMIAAAKGYCKVVEKLLIMGADPCIKGNRGYTALDWSVNLNGYNQCTLMLQTAMVQRQQQIGQQLVVPVQSHNLNKMLLDMYHVTTNDEKIDHRLIFDVIYYIHTHLPYGSILVFLPGYDDILEQFDTITSRMNSNVMPFKIYMLHSNMQTNDQKNVFKPTPNIRKIILSTNIAETSITIDDVVYVIDTGKAKMKHFDSVSATTSLTATWISQACAKQRSGRAGRTRPGICYRLYSKIRYEAMEQFTLPEMLRVPLTEICLQTAIIANKISILNFLSKAIQPPSTMSIKQSIKLLQKLGALDDDENLTEMGLLLADLPVDVRYGKVLIYGILMKCIDPILTIVSALSVNDPFVLPVNNYDKDKASKIKKEFSEGSFSDCLCLLRVFQKWNEMKSAFKEKQFCSRNFLNSGTMDTISNLRVKILGHLRSIGLVRSHGMGNIQDLNQNSNNWPLVKACIAAGLYPNVCRVDREYATIKTRIDKKISPHPSSVIRDKTLKQNKENILQFPAEWIIFEEKTRSGSHCLIRCNTIVTPITVALFCGTINMSEHENMATWIDPNATEADIDPDVSDSNKCKLIIDDWINFVLDSDAAYAIFNLRQKLNTLIGNFVGNPRYYNISIHDNNLIGAIARLLEAEDDSSKFPHHNDIGMRPRPMMTNTSHNRSFELSFDAKNHNHNYNHKQQNQNHYRKYGNKSFNGNGENLTYKYFIVNAPSIDMVENIRRSNVWEFGSSTYTNLNRIVKRSPNIRAILFFQITVLKCFYGAAKFEILNNRHQMTLISSKKISFDDLSSNEFLKIDPKTTYDGQEMNESMGRLLYGVFTSHQ